MSENKEKAKDNIKPIINEGSGKKVALAKLNDKGKITNINCNFRAGSDGYSKALKLGYKVIKEL